MDEFNVFDSKIKNLNNENRFFSLKNIFGYKKVSEFDILNKGYLSNQDVYNVVSRIAMLTSSIPVQVMKGEDEVFEGDPFYEFFHNGWGKSQTLKESVNAIETNLLIFGVAYILKQDYSTGFPSDKLWVLPSQLVTPIKNTNDFFSGYDYYEFNDGLKTVRYLPEELVVLKYYNPNEALDKQEGLSPLQAGWNVVESSNNRNTAEKNMLENGGATGLITPKTNEFGLKQASIEAVRKLFTSIIGGAKNFNKVQTLSQPVDYIKIGMSATDLKIIESRFQHIRDITALYGVPSLLWNDPESRTHSNYLEAKKALYTQAIIPNYEQFLDIYTRSIVKEYNDFNGTDYYIRIDLKSIQEINPNYEDRVQDVLSLYSKGLISRERGREMLGESENIEETQLTPLETLMRLDSGMANTFFNSLTEEEKTKLLRDTLGL